MKTNPLVHIPIGLKHMACAIAVCWTAFAAEGTVLTRPSYAGAGEYRIGSGDILQVGVWKEPDASVASVVVRYDGRISLPLINDIKVIGLTTTEAEHLIANELIQYIPHAQVSVLVREVHSKKIYIVGAVRKEGMMELQSPISVLEALTEAGGLNEYAKRKKIYILRKVNGQDQRLPFDYEAAIKGIFTRNVQLQPDDMIVVPH